MATKRTMTAAHAPVDDHHGAGLYEVRIKGQLDAWWSNWFDGLSFRHASDGTTIIHGRVVDQTTLHGLLSKVRDLGLPLVSVIPVEAEHANVPNVKP